MKITRRALSEMVAYEVRRRLRELVEKDEEDGKKKGGEGKPRKPSTADAEDSPSPKVGRPGSRATADTGDDIDGPAVDGERPDPVAQDDEMNGNDRPESDDDAAIDSDGDGGEEPSGIINDELSGKTVQALTIEPRSNVLPGAKEVVLSFNESTDTLRILVTQTGEVKFFWRGQLHDLP